MLQRICISWFQFSNWLGFSSWCSDNIPNLQFMWSHDNLHFVATIPSNQSNSSRATRIVANVKHLVPYWSSFFILFQCRSPHKVNHAVSLSMTPTSMSNYNLSSVISSWPSLVSPYAAVFKGTWDWNVAYASRYPDKWVMCSTLRYQASRKVTQKYGCVRAKTKLGVTCYMLSDAFPKIHGKMVKHDECRVSAGQLHLQSKKARWNETPREYILNKHCWITTESKWKFFISFRWISQLRPCKTRFGPFGPNAVTLTIFYEQFLSISRWRTDFPSYLIYDTWKCIVFG